MQKFTSNIREAGRPATDSAKASMYGWGGPSPFPVTYVPINAGIFNCYIWGEIEDCTQFIHTVEALQQATENDSVVIHLSTDGGSLDATDTLLTAMRQCAGRVLVKATGGVHSAGTVILLSADEFELSENFNALIHNGSCGSGGKFSDYVAHSRHNVKYMSTVMFNTYKGFLTDDEIMQLLDGKDFWLNAEEFVTRHEARNAYEAAAEEALQVQAQAIYEQMLAEAAGEDKPAKPKVARKKAAPKK
jgi:ATP-dependent protease ClpP protease subunit